jgi:phytoene dehydrogenase-like protein
MEDIDRAYRETLAGRPASRPVIEMTIPSALDSTLAPPGQHVVQLFVQYAPYELQHGSWADDKFKSDYADSLFKIIDKYWYVRGADARIKRKQLETCQTVASHAFPALCIFLFFSSLLFSPSDGFSASVIGRDVLSPLDLERIFGLHKGNIMHGALSLSQLAVARPAPGFADHRTPVAGLYLCGAGAHPGGGVMGAAGRNCATVVLNDKKHYA